MSALELLRAAGEQTRLRILMLLRDGELTVSELVHILAQSQPRVSRHLKLLSSSGLVDWVREGSWVFYRLSRAPAASSLVEWVQRHADLTDDAMVRDQVRLNQVRERRQKQADAYFAQNAEQWDQIRALQGSDSAIEKAFLTALVKKPDLHLLDIGTGTGRMLQVFAPYISKGFGVDSSAEMLKVARTRLSQGGVTHCQVQQGNMYALELPDASQDVVVLHQVLHFADTPVSVFEEAARVLREDGQLLIADYAPHTLEILREKHAHRRLGFSKQDMKRWAASAGVALKHVRRESGPELEIDIWSGEKKAQVVTSQVRHDLQGDEKKHVH